MWSEAEPCSILASLVCGFIFGLGLLISGMTQPSKVLGFLDIFGAWDPSLAVVMAAALAVSGVGYWLAQQRPAAGAGAKFDLPTKTEHRHAAGRGLGAVRHRLGAGRPLPGPGAGEPGDAVAAGHRVLRRHGRPGMVAHDMWLRRRAASKPGRRVAARRRRWPESRRIEASDRIPAPPPPGRRRPRCVAPVMKRPASEASSSSAPSRSRASPKRPTGISRLIAAPCSLVEIVAVQLGDDPARRDGVDADALERELERQRLGELDHARPSTPHRARRPWRRRARAPRRC